MRAKFIRQHGFQTPLHSLQVSSWVLTSIMIIGAYCVILPTLPNSLKITFGILYSISITFTIILGFKTTQSDPTDEVVYSHRKAIKNGYYPYSEIFDTARYTSLCTMCSTSVASSSKHCGQCNRCVSNFDHHCKWLNNCIGGKNYRVFIKLLVSLMVTYMILLGFSIYSIYLYFDRHEEYLDYIDESYSYRKGLPFLMISFFLAICSCAIVIADGNLIVLHLYLYRRGLTTYEYIMEKRRKLKNVTNNQGIRDNSDNSSITVMTNRFTTYTHQRTIEGNSDTKRILPRNESEPVHTSLEENPSK